MARGLNDEEGEGEEEEGKDWARRRRGKDNLCNDYDGGDDDDDGDTS